MTGREKYLITVNWQGEDLIKPFDDLDFAKIALQWNGDRKAGITKITMWPYK